MVLIRFIHPDRADLLSGKLRLQSADGELTDFCQTSGPLALPELKLRNNLVTDLQRQALLTEKEALTEKPQANQPICLETKLQIQHVV